MPENRRPIGRRILHGRALREARAEIRSRVLAHLSRGQSNPWWGQGRFVRHIVVGVFEPVSLCARFVGDVNSESMVTPFGMICPPCAREWDALIALDAHRVRAANETLIERPLDHGTDVQPVIERLHPDSATIARTYGAEDAS